MAVTPQVDLREAAAVSAVVAAGLGDVPDLPQPGVGGRRVGSLHVVH